MYYANKNVFIVIKKKKNYSSVFKETHFNTKLYFVSIIEVNIEFPYSFQ